MTSLKYTKEEFNKLDPSFVEKFKQVHLICENGKYFMLKVEDYKWDKSTWRILTGDFLTDCMILKMSDKEWLEYAKLHKE